MQQSWLICNQEADEEAEAVITGVRAGWGFSGGHQAGVTDGSALTLRCMHPPQMTRTLRWSVNAKLGQSMHLTLHACMHTVQAVVCLAGWRRAR